MEKAKTLNGYFDGKYVRLLDDVSAEPFRKVIITFTDEFISNERHAKVKELRGILSQYSDPNLSEKEKEAWEQAAAEKHGIV